MSKFVNPVDLTSTPYVPPYPVRSYLKRHPKQPLQFERVSSVDLVDVHHAEVHIGGRWAIVVKRVNRNLPIRHPNRVSYAWGTEFLAKSLERL